MKEIQINTFDDEIDTPGKMWIEDDVDDDCVYLSFEICVLGTQRTCRLPIAFLTLDDVEDAIKMLSVVEDRLSEKFNH